MHTSFSLKSISIQYWSLNLKWLFFNVSKIDPYLNERSIDIYEIRCFMVSGCYNMAEPINCSLMTMLLHLLHVFNVYKQTCADASCCAWKCHCAQSDPQHHRHTRYPIKCFQCAKEYMARPIIRRRSEKGTEEPIKMSIWLQCLFDCLFSNWYRWQIFVDLSATNT